MASWVTTSMGAVINAITGYLTFVKNLVHSHIPTPLPLESARGLLTSKSEEYAMYIP